MIEGLFGLYKVTRAAFDTTSKLLHLQLRGLGSEGNDDGAEPVDDATVLQQFGVAVRPVVARTLRVLGLRWGDEVWPLKVWDKAKLPTDLEEGETRIYAVGDNAKRIRIRQSQGFAIEVNGATITIDSNGKITITPASGQDVVLNGGTLKVARVTDATSGHSHTVTGNAGPYPIASGVAVTTTDTIASSAGAANVKA